MELLDKLNILTDSAKYDVACTSSGVNRSSKGYTMGTAAGYGICHSFSADGRCISLLKVLFSNVCAYDCAYCVNRRSNDIPRASFTPRELADLTWEFYRRNYIEGLFLSSAVIGSPNRTTELLIETLSLLRRQYGFGGYIHAKAIPGTDPLLLQQLGLLADRMSVNIELPSSESLAKLAPDKSRADVLSPMRKIAQGIQENRQELVEYKRGKKFVPAGQSTQMIVGATAETDYHILNLTQHLYQKYQLKRVFFSAYIPVAENSLLPSPDTKPPLLREHRLYQADWLLRFYHFQAEELLSEEEPDFNPYLDPKCNWAIRHMEFFPVDVQYADLHTLLRVPGIGSKSARRIIKARQTARLQLSDLRLLGVVWKRAKYFILCSGKQEAGIHLTSKNAVQSLLEPTIFSSGAEQLSFLEEKNCNITKEEVVSCLCETI